MKAIKGMLLASALASISMVGIEAAQAAFASPRISGSVRMSGAVLDKGCDVSGDSTSLAVDLGELDVSSFGGAAGATSGSGVIEIPLANCPTMAGGVGIVFDGPADLADNHLLALQGEGAAEGVGIAFYETDGTTQVPLHGQSEFRVIADGQSATLLRYIVKFKSTSAKVVAGSSAAVANFTLVYN